MRKLFKNYWALILIVILAAGLRLYDLGKTPPSLMWDETALGYNAYSILKTARDEYGNFLPVIFKSFGDYKPGLYVYLTVPFVAVFGLSEMAVRLPSALGGVATVLLVYLLTRAFFPKEKFSIGEIAALVLAISPWHIEFSRGAWEANLAVFLVVFGTLVFLKALQDTRFLPLAAVIFGLTFLAYQGAKVFTSLFIFGLLIFYQKDIRKISVRVLLVSAFCLAIFLAPIFWGTLSGMGGRARVMSVFSYPRSGEEIQEILNQDKISQSSLIFRLFHSETLNFGRGILGRYFNHFSGRFLFFEGDWSNKRLGVPYMGVMYFIEITFLLVGIYFLARQKETRARNFIFYWLLISPLPAAATRDSISAVRALNMVIPLVFITGVGIYQTILWLKNYSRLIQCILYSIFCILYSWNFFYFLDQYFIHAPIHNSSTSQYGYREVVNFVAPIAKNYDKIIFTQKYGQPYIYWLFYTKYNPSDYQKQAYLKENPWGDVGMVEKVSDIEFRNVYWPTDRGCQNCLFIDDEFGLPDKDISQTKGAKILKEVRFLDGRLAFRIAIKD
ncbi:MAG: glycosyltransferase family 39 protein [Patescibacteria group bacterium]